MGAIPKRQIITGAVYYRKILTFFEKYLVLPHLNPSWLQVAGLLLSLYYLYLNSDLSKAIALAIILLLDWLDGAIARAQKMTSLNGWMIDVLIDRVSEAFIFWTEMHTPIGKIFFTLWLINSALSIYSVKTGKHFILALRFFFLVIVFGRIIL